MGAHVGCAQKQSKRPRHEVADIFRVHGEAYRSRHVLTPEQGKAMWAIKSCRTAVLGGHMDKCVDCDHKRPSYNTCHNRHCPKCQALAAAKWLKRRMDRILPVHYFHVVFTLPGELRTLGMRNQRMLYELLLRTAADTLLTLGRDPERYGALLGVTTVLHTWTRDLKFHPHVHCIVTGGGLSVDDTDWVDADPDFLFPVNVMGQLFRGKFLDALARVHEQGELVLPRELSPPGAFDEMRGRLYRKSWVVYAKRPFAGPKQVFSYLGRYTHRVGISNHRLLDVNDDTVTIATRDGKSATMSPEVFIGRFLQHILPKGFGKVRHYGLMASANVKRRLETARRLLAERQPPPDYSDMGGEDLLGDWKSFLQRLTGIDLNVCPACGSRRLQRRTIPPEADNVTGSLARAPPGTVGTR